MCFFLATVVLCLLFRIFWTLPSPFGTIYKQIWCNFIYQRITCNGFWVSFRYHPQFCQTST